MRTVAMPLTLLVAGLIALPTAWAQSYGDKEHAELAKALQGVKMTLERGLTASAKEGKPISGKYELEDGKLQLSVYTMKDGHPVADVTLVKGTDWKAVSEKLD